MPFQIIEQSFREQLSRRPVRAVWRSAAACIVAMCAGGMLFSRAGSAQKAEEDVRFFETRIRPVLAERCLRCHGPQEQKGGLRLDSRAGALRGGRRGRAIAPEDPRGSLLLQAIRGAGTLRMPPDGALRADESDALAEWIRRGAPWPERASAPPVRTARPRPMLWSVRPVARPILPAVHSADRRLSPIDRFILAGLERQGLRLAPEADRRTLIRRAAFDLTGLPPGLEDVEAFVRDRAPDAWEKVVDRLLASPHYGERWARHWLDVVRYTDSFDARGLGGEMDIAEAWRYRDWVVQAFQRDLPFDQFVQKQIAGDILSARAPGGFDADSLVATGMLSLGNWGGGDADKDKLLTDIADDQVDVVSRAFLGLTIGCARCHDHKFDPITTEDYYGLAGIFFSTHILANPGPKTNGPPMLRIPLAPAAELERQARLRAEADAAGKRLEEARAQARRAFAKSLAPQTTRYLLAAWELLYPERSSRTDRQNQDPDVSARTLGLNAYALRRWTAYLGQDDFRLLTTPVRDLSGAAGVHAWKGPEDTPSLTVNTGEKPVTLLTFTLPARSVAVHPGPKSEIAVVWRSPFAGVAAVRGRVQDADPACGDGIAWEIALCTDGRTERLATGAFPNGGQQEFAQGAGSDRLQTVRVQTGDLVRLLVLPKETHVCDTTTVELRLEEQGGAGRVWDLTRDLLPDALRGNPRPDGYGNPDVWGFYDMAAGLSAGSAAAAPEVRAAWNRVARAVAAGRQDLPALQRAAADFARRFSPDAADSPFLIRPGEEEMALPPEARSELAQRARELEQARQALPPPLEYANGALEGGCPNSPHAGLHDVRVHVRGSYARLGVLVPRRFPAVLAGDAQAPITQGSGRLELARWLASGQNPLTARVLVNRIWLHHFGEGIVRTPGNFGFLGERPTHPELLDYLASEFVRGGWSIRKLHRMLLLTAAYRQSSRAPAETVRKDPDNRLFGRMNRRRLEAEELRDSLLAAAGELDETRGGKPVRDFMSPRRTLYLMTIRSDRSGFGPLFDVADPTGIVDRRTASTVAPQALFLLNHPFTLERTHAIARRLCAEPSGDDTVRIRGIYARLYGRPPAVQEIAIGRKFLERARGRNAGHASPEAAWEAYAQILLCANEFLYVD